MIINKTKNLFGQEEDATNKIQFNDNLPDAFAGNSNTSNDGGDDDEDCCIRFKQTKGDFVCTFFDGNGNVLDPFKQFFPCASVRSAQCTGTLTEEQEAACKPWKCEGIEWWGLFQYSSCKKEVKQLNDNLNGGDGPGMVTSLYTNTLKFTAAFYEKAGCCNSAPSVLNVKYETPITVTVPTPNGICKNRFSTDYTGEPGNISNMSEAIIKEVMDDAYRRKNPDIMCLDKITP